MVEWFGFFEKKRKKREKEILGGFKETQKERERGRYRRLKREQREEEEEENGKKIKFLLLAWPVRRLHT